MRHIIKYILVSVAAALLSVSCLEDRDTYRAGFFYIRPSGGSMAEYANSTSDSILFLSYGSWRLQSFGSYDNSWISLPLESGLPGIVAFNVEMQPAGLPSRLLTETIPTMPVVALPSTSLPPVATARWAAPPT